MQDNGVLIMRKGIAIPVVGTMIILVSYVIMIAITSINGQMTMAALLHGDLASSAVHEVEWMRKMTATSVEFAGEDASRVLLGDAGYWTTAGPTCEQMKGRLEDNIASRLPTGAMIGSSKERKLQMDLASIKVEQCDVSLCPGTGELVNSKCFKITGDQTFSLADSRMSANIGSSIRYDTKVDSSYFKLVSVGRKLFENEVWRGNDAWVDFNSPGDNFDIVGAKGPAAAYCRGKKVAGDTSVVGYYWLIPMADFVNVSIFCGLGDTPGLTSLDDFTTASDQVNMVIKEMKSYLNGRYSGLTFDITHSTASTATSFSSIISFTITDASYAAPLKFKSIVSFAG